MVDVFDEVEEDLRRERLKSAWKKAAPLVYATAALIIVGVAGWRAYDAYVTTQEQAAGDRFLNALEAVQAGNIEEAETALQAIATDGASGYPVLAQFRLASLNAAQGDLDVAIAGFDAIADDSSQEDLIRDFARLRAAYLALDTAEPTQVQARVAGIANSESPYAASAKEVMALAAYKQGDRDEAVRLYTEIVADPGILDILRNRAQIGLAVAQSLPEAGETQ